MARCHALCMTSTETLPDSCADRASSYVLVVSYTAPLRAVDAAMPAHRRFLDEHFATGEFLASGPREPRVGGVILARFYSRARLTAVIAADPFVRQGLASYEAIAFEPTRGPFALPMVDPIAAIPGASTEVDASKQSTSRQTTSNADAKEHVA